MRIKEILREKGMTSKELALKLGMSETGLSLAIGESGNPSLKRLEQIAKELDVSIAELFEPPHEKGVVICPGCGKRYRLVEE